MGVKLADVLSNNSSLKDANSTGPTAVFVGATAGIGLGALQSLLKHTNSATVYIVGRSPAKLAGLITELKRLNDAATLVPVHAADLTRVKDAEAAAAEIAAQVDQVDLLVLSPGYVTFAGREEHDSEGIDKLTAVRYHSRMRFLITLAPALQAAPAARVINVLAGGKEGPLFRDDLLLKGEGHYGIEISGGAAASMTTLLFEELKGMPGWENVVFEHVFPGIVSTGLEIRGTGAVLGFLLKYVARTVIYLLGYTQEEAGERVIFAATSGRFRRLRDAVSGEGSLVQKGSDGLVGSGVYLVQGNSSTVAGTKKLGELRTEGMGKVVYDHTMEVFGKIEKGERA